MQTMAQLLAQQPFLSGMRPVHLERVSNYAHRSVFRAGSRIFHEGGHANRCWIIREGRVDVDTTIPERGVVTVETLGPGAMLGWSWMFPPYTWQFTARAVEPTAAIFFYGTILREYCEKDHSLGYELLKRMSAVMVKRLQAGRKNMLAFPEYKARG